MATIEPEIYRIQPPFQLRFFITEKKNSGPKLPPSSSVFLITGDPEIGCDPETEFDCGDDGKMCIPLESVCNHKNDCGNWADEPKDLCNVNECSQSLMHQQKGQKTMALCDQQCIDLPIGYKCACKEGYHLVDNSTCQGLMYFFIDFSKVRSFFR